MNGRRQGEGRQDEGGQAAVELALVLPLVFLLLLALLQVGVLVRDQVLLTHAAREAAREAAVSDSPAGPARAAALGAGLDPRRLKVEVHRPRGASDRVEVRLTYRAPSAVVLVGQVLGDVTLHARAAMRVEK